MRYLTDRKRAVGRGASGTGTEHHWAMIVSAIALAILVPVWLWIFGSALGSSHAEVVATFSRPFPAILTALVLFVGMRHFAKGAHMMIEDYWQGTTRKVLMMLADAFSYLTIATGLWALARLAL